MSRPSSLGLAIGGIAIAIAIVAAAFILSSSNEPGDTAVGPVVTNATPPSGDAAAPQDGETTTSSVATEEPDSTTTDDTHSHDTTDDESDSSTTTTGQGGSAGTGEFVVPGLDACGGGEDGPAAPDLMPGVVILESPETVEAGATVVCADGSSPVFIVIDEWMDGLGAEVIAQIDGAVIYEVSRDTFAPSDPVPLEVVASIIAAEPALFEGRTTIGVTDDVLVFDTVDWFVERLVIDPSLVATVDPLLLADALNQIAQDEDFFNRFDGLLLGEFSQQLEQFGPSLLQNIEIPQLNPSAP